MANSKYGYVKRFEADDAVLPECWIVVRLDGKGFTKFTAAHGLAKPSDERALSLMDRAAQEVMHEFRDIRIAFGESDEYSFVFHKHTALYGRRASKLLSLVVSLFTAAYVRFWPHCLPDTELQQTPCFDARAVCYPNNKTLRDYLAWRQADTHINTQYNTCYWALVNSGKSGKEAQEYLKGTQTAFKNELLYREFKINYNELPARFRKGSVVFWKPPTSLDPSSRSQKHALMVQHEDIIKDAFWEQYPHILS
ncbi:hypothetical protein WJX73_002862 [Symbiochloris irregularis]|uniref:tRNA(His) guanylyltransferase n=1 Tax=Symbiochloris irregularis TaxID=706552 RepID=A0AAW1PUY7_9CHLO